MTPIYRVLAVEDDPDTLALVRYVLDGLPVDVEHAGTGGEAIAILQKQVPDLVLLDLNLPDMRGWDVLEQVKADPRLSKLHVIVMTSHQETVHRLIGRMQPITAYLRKPVAADTLREHVRQALSQP